MLWGFSIRIFVLIKIADELSCDITRTYTKWILIFYQWFIGRLIWSWFLYDLWTKNYFLWEKFTHTTQQMRTNFTSSSIKITHYVWANNGVTHSFLVYISVYRPFCLLLISNTLSDWKDSADKLLTNGGWRIDAKWAPMNQEVQFCMKVKIERNNLYFQFFFLESLWARNAIKDMS